jgi:hypothetical protein
MIHINRARQRVREKKFITANWSGRLQGFPCFIIGNGPSLEEENIHLLDNYFTIGINRIFLKDNFDPTILMWQDLRFWQGERNTIKKLKAIKFCRDATDPEKIGYHFKLKAGPFVLTSRVNLMIGNGASGPLAFELAYCLGCKVMIFLGYDCKYKDGKTDFYGINKDHAKHTLHTCRRGLLWINGWFEKKTVQIINCSDNNVFPQRVSLEDAIKAAEDLCGDKGLPKNREFFVSNLLSPAGV